ncbi:carboxymuconolactone decarboxylase family protein [Sphingobium sp.]|uniref:carboxymuconolactone decarboxylase family protein n=1 Tax=Sphingobium sp. TaxID=1912891 RepID=UPI003B3AEA4F
MNDKIAPPPVSVVRQRFGDFAPRLVDFTDDVLFGQLWEGEALSKRDRSLVTISSLVAMNRAEQLRPHILRGIANGLTQAEIIETITHLAFYSGWPTAMTAIAIARDSFTESQD